jgi:hypothetical protein
MALHQMKLEHQFLYTCILWIARKQKMQVYFQKTQSIRLYELEQPTLNNLDMFSSGLIVYIIDVK